MSQQNQFDISPIDNRKNSLSPEAYLSSTNNKNNNNNNLNSDDNNVNIIHEEMITGRKNEKEKYE